MMTDLGWTLAAILGFALVCVLFVVWALSKRTVNVTQVQENHAAPVSVYAGDTGGGLGIAPALIGGAFKFITAGIVLTLVANLVIAALNGLGTGLQAIGNGLSNQAEPKQITVVYPTPQPIPTVAPLPTVAPVPQVVPQAVPQSVPVPDLLPVIVGVLALAALGLWGYVAVTLLRRKPIKRNNVVTPRNVSAREVFGVASDVKQGVKNVRQA